MRPPSPLFCFQAQEALRRAKFKFPGRQKIIVSRKWGFTPYDRDDYVQWKREGRIKVDGVYARVNPAPVALCHVRQVA